MIDTLKISEELLKLGFPETQAKGLARLQADAVSEGAATKADLISTESKLGEKSSKLEAKFDKLEAKFDRVLWLGAVIGLPCVAAAMKYLFRL